jgi:hypothetical protein
VFYRYRGKILKIENDSYEVIYVDYGDKRTLRKEELQKIHPEFLKLRFQAMQATLNLGYVVSLLSSLKLGPMH